MIGMKKLMVALGLTIEVAKQKQKLVKHVKLGIKITLHQLMKVLGHHHLEQMALIIIVETQVIHTLEYGVMLETHRIALNYATHFHLWLQKAQQLSLVQVYIAKQMYMEFTDCYGVILQQ